MNRHSRLYSVLSYITWIGFLIALFARDKDDTLVRRHLNQALILNVISTLATAVSRLGGIFTSLGSIVDLAVFILAVMGIIRAFRMNEEPLPLVGSYTLIE